MEFNLSILVIIPLLTAVAVFFCGKPNCLRWFSFTGAVTQLAATAILIFAYLSERSAGNAEQMLFQQRYMWYEAFNIQYYTGVDGISVAMIGLTAVVVLAGVLISWNMSRLPKEFFILLMLLSVGAYGFFISLDLFTMFFFLEIAVIPKFMLIAIWGSGKKEYSAMKLALMLMTGSALVLVGILITYFNSAPDGGEKTFDILKLSQTAIPYSTQLIIFPLLFAGFGIFTAMFPFHTWAPDGHSSAPTAASMFLAGISMKLGGYGCLRVATYLMPAAADHYSWVIILLASIAIIYGAFATLMQTDLKYINAYSSVSHCGFVLLGIGMLTKTAITGAVMQMVSHGLMTALFFAAIGMIYERTHTRQVAQLGGLLKAIPFIGVIFVIAGLCSLGLPGFSGFASEMTIFVGSWQNADTFSRVATVLACASIVVTAVYILRASGKTVMGPLAQNFLNLKDATWTERTASVLLVAGILAIGITPFWFIDLVNPDSEHIISKIVNGISNR